MMVEMSILPIGKDEHIGKYVAEAVKVIHESGLEYRLAPMGTIIVGEWDKVMPVVKQAHDAVHRHSSRVMTKLKIDDFAGTERMPEDKVASVEKLLNFKVKK
jgi:uncharacterized protein (TIGR00106 family)